MAYITGNSPRADSLRRAHDDAAGQTAPLNDQHRLMLCGEYCDGWTVPQVLLPTGTEFQDGATRYLAERFHIENPRFGSVRRSRNTRVRLLGSLAVRSDIAARTGTGLRRQRSPAHPRRLRLGQQLHDPRPASHLDLPSSGQPG
jgi:hypothetical protein